MSKSKLSTFTATITTITSMFGAGINFMPFAFESIGYLTASIIMVTMILLTSFTLYAVAFAASTQKDDDNMTYSSIAYNKSYALGLGVDLSVILAQFLAGLAFFNYIVGLCVPFITGVKVGDEKYNYYKLITMTVIGIVFYFLALKKDLSSLKYTSYAGVASVLYLFGLMIFLNFFLGDAVRTKDFNAMNVNYHSGIPMIILAMACQTNMVKVYMEMESQTTGSIVLVSVVSAIFGGFIYASVGLFGYKLLGDGVREKDLIGIFVDKDSVFNTYLKKNYPKLVYVPKLAIVGSMIVLVGSFPLQLNPITATLVKLLATERNAEKVRIVSATLICALIFVINLIPNLSLDFILGIAGAIFINALDLFFPCMYYVMSARKFNALSLLSVVIMIFSVCVGGYILYNVLKQ